MTVVDTRALSEGFRLRASGEEVDRWRAAASEEGLSVAAWLRKQARENPTAADAQRAHSLVAKAIADGTLSRSPCEVCGAAAEGHHDDYSEPLMVRWLCKKHHRIWHQKNPSGVAWSDGVTRSISFRCPEDLYLRVVAASEREERSVSQIIILALEASFGTPAPESELVYEPFYDDGGTPGPVPGRVESETRVTPTTTVSDSTAPNPAQRAAPMTQDRDEAVEPLEIPAAQLIASQIEGVTTAAMLPQSNLAKVMAGLAEIPMCEVSGLPRAACKRACCTKYK